LVIPEGHPRRLFGTTRKFRRKEDGGAHTISVELGFKAILRSNGLAKNDLGREGGSGIETC